jgi:uracil-DNA glycosylase
VDAREQLRRYLEQRREMGESELVLDSLTVEDALRILGGAAGTVRADAAPEDKSENRAESRDTTATADWRDTLRAVGGEPPPREQRHRAVFATLRPPDAESPEPSKAVPRVEAPSARPAVVRADAPPHEAPRTPVVSDVPVAPPGITVGSDARELFGGPLAHLDSLDAIVRTVRDCKRCPLYATATNPVPGEGPHQAGVMIVGEAPGANEDATGRPFVGPAGQLLEKILAAVNLRREEVFICNVLKHRPPGNRNPNPDEVAACSPYLVRQIELVKPKVILALGTFAAQTLLATKLSIGKLRGQLHRYHGVPLIVTYHPAALLRNPGWKRPKWEDVQLARRVLDRAGGA